MTTEELDERIKALRFGEFEIIDHGKAFWTIPDKDIPKVKKLISDCIDAVLPAAYTEDQGIDAEMASHNGTLDEIQANKRNLLGEK